MGVEKSTLKQLIWQTDFITWACDGDYIVRVPAEVTNLKQMFFPIPFGMKDTKIDGNLIIMGKYRFEFKNKKDVTHKSLTMALADESRLKALHAGQTKIGFLP